MTNTAAPPGGKFLALDKCHDDGGDDAGKMRGWAENSGGADAGSDGLLMRRPERLPGASAQKRKIVAVGDRAVPPAPQKRKQVKRRCSQKNCDNGVVQGGVCVRHGARRTYAPSGHGEDARSAGEIRTSR